MWYFSWLFLFNSHAISINFRPSIVLRNHIVCGHVWPLVQRVRWDFFWMHSLDASGTTLTLLCRVPTSLRTFRMLWFEGLQPEIDKLLHENSSSWNYHKDNVELNYVYVNNMRMNEIYFLNFQRLIHHKHTPTIIRRRKHETKKNV